MDSR
jgi:hypothetical protein